MQCEAKTLTAANEQEWGALAAAHPFGKALATPEAWVYWQDAGWSQHVVGAFADGRLVGLACLVIRKVSPWPWSLSRLFALLPDASDTPGVSACLLRGVEELARSHRAAEIESQCRIPDPAICGHGEFYEGVRAALVAARYAETPVFRHTYVVRIDVDDDALLGSYQSNCRRDVRKALREGVEVACLDRPEDLHAFCDALERMCLRKGLAEQTSGLFESYWPLVEKGYFRLFGASYGGVLRNMALIDALGIPQYTLGATLESAFEKGTPPTGQALHYFIMQWFRARGVRYYDLGGSPGPVPQEGHPNYTVWRFKHAFGGPYVHMMHYHRRRLSVPGSLLPVLARRMGRLGP